MSGVLMALDRVARLVALAAAVAIVVFAPARADEIVTLNYTRNAGGAVVAQSYLLVHDGDPELFYINQVATLLLLVGGGGRLRLADQQLSIDNTNFLVRSRHLFAAAGPFNVAVMDAASDFLDVSRFAEGLKGQRTSAAYLEDVQRVIADLRTRFPGVPLIVVGTSRGSIAAAHVAAQLAPPLGPDRIVLSSPVTVAREEANSLSDVALHNVRTRVLVVAHRGDRCIVSPAANINSRIIRRLTRTRADTKVFDGGLPAIGKTCSGLSPHGYFGIGLDVVTYISRWIAKRPPPPKPIRGFRPAIPGKQ